MIRARLHTRGLLIFVLATIGCGATKTEAPAAPAVDQAPRSVEIVDVAPAPRPAAAGTSGATAPELTPRQSAAPPAGGVSRRDPDGLVIEDLVVGQGAPIAPRHKVTVHYDGKLLDGKRFDSSRERDRPFVFTFGAAHVIPGWERGLEGMRVGGTRRLEIPPELAYGTRGSPPKIPPGATLVFEVELLDVQ